MASNDQLRSLRCVRRRRFLMLCGTLLLSLRFARHASAEVANEYELKAVFLFHFASFVEWPSVAFSGKSSPFVIAILGDDPFGRCLDTVIRSETVRDRLIRVERYGRGQALQRCHILFVCRSEGSYLGQILQKIQGQPVLSVSDLDRFPQLGGIIGLNTGAGRVQLTVNVKAAREAKLAVSSKLLRLAQLVES